MRRDHCGYGCGLAALVVAGLAVPQAAAQDPVADFYRGKTINISVGFSAGGGYDLHARTLARVFGRHVPGNPAVLVRNVPGAAGLVLLNSLANTLPKDGTEIATFDRGMANEPLVNPEHARFDALKLNWIGSTDNDASTCFSWHASPVKTFEDVFKQELIVSGTNNGGDAVAFPRVMNAVLGTKFRVVTGYPGSTESLLAVERGETQGFCSMGFVTMEATRPQWIRERKVNFLVQLAPYKNKDHLDVPLALDYAKAGPDRQALEFVVSPNLFARPFTTSPGVPEARVRALRKAFEESMADPEYIAEAAARRMHVELVTGQQIETLLKRIYSMPPTVIERVKNAIRG